MQKTILLLLFSFVILSCGNQSQKKESTENSTLSIEEATPGTSNFAVVWTAPSAKDIGDYGIDISNEFNALHAKGIIENAYFDNESNQKDHFPNIAFFMKANSKKDAKSTLDKLIIVQKGIASYNIFPVGLQWLKRNKAAIEKNGTTNSFVTVWTTNTSKTDDQVVREQNDKIMELWNKGTIENVYFDIEGIQKENDKTDFVFFVNSNSREEADSICMALPFFRENYSTYKIFPVGVFWFGAYNLNNPQNQ